MIKRIIYFLYSFLICFSLTAQELYKSLDAHNGASLTTAIDNDGELIITGGADNRAYLWELETGKKLKILAHSDPVNDVAFSSNAKKFVTVAGQRLIVFDTKSGKPVQLLRDLEKTGFSVDFNPVNDEIASGSENGDILIWDVSGNLKATLKQHDKKVNDLAFSPDGKWLASASEDGTLRIWNAANGMNTQTIETGQNEIYSVDYSADGLYVASGGKEGGVVLWDAYTGDKKKSFITEGAIRSVVFTPDVQYLLAVGENNKIWIWEVESGTEKGALPAHSKGINAIALNDGGTYMVTTGNDQTLKIWDIKNMKIGKKKSVEAQSDQPKLVCQPLVIKDDNENGILEPAEKPSLTFVIENKGAGTAYDVRAKVSVKDHIRGLEYEKEVLIGNLETNAERAVTIPVTTAEDLESTASTFVVSFEEANGNAPSPLRVNFQTRGTQQYSYVMITGHEFTSATGKAEIGAPITLKLRLKNTSKGEASDVKVNYLLPEQVMAVDKLSETIPRLAPGEEREISMQFYAGKEFKGEHVKMGVNIEGVAFTNANDLIFEVDMNEPLPGREVYAVADQQPEKPVYRGSGDMLQGLNVSKAKSMEIGKYYALIIGIDKYTGHWTPLQNAVNDAKAVEQMLRSKYKFDDFRTLYNEEATRVNIIKQMEWLVENVKPKDNVFIFYSGHGEFKDALNKGYWVPVDASSNSTSQYISNSDIQTFLSGIRSKHTLLVSDACFSGDIFRGNTISVPFEESEKYYTEVHNLLSRQALTSGGVEPVMDGGRDGHSVFTYYFLKALQNNQNKYLDAGQLYNKIKIPVINNSQQTPKISPVKNTGDEGGQFIFILKE